MSFMDRFKSPEGQEKKLAGLEMENEIQGKMSEVEEKKAIIAQLKKQHGSDWKSVLGVKNWVDLSTLRSLLKGSTNLSHLKDGGSLAHLRNPSRRL